MNRWLSRKPVAVLVASLFIGVSAPDLAAKNWGQGSDEDVSNVNLENIVSSAGPSITSEFYNGAVAMGWGASANVSNNTLNVDNIVVTDAAPDEVNFTGGRIHKPNQKEISRDYGNDDPNDDETIRIKKGFLTNTANHNTVNFNSVSSASGSTLIRVSGGFIRGFGGNSVDYPEISGTGEASFNTVVVSNSNLAYAEVLGADITGDKNFVKGQWYESSSLAPMSSATLNENSVAIKQSEFGTVYIAGATTDAETATVNKNSVLLDGVTIKNGLTSFIVGGNANNGEASGNTVEIKNSKFANNVTIYGGKGVTATHNHVIIGENVTSLNGGRLFLQTLYGGWNGQFSNIPVDTGNKLTLASTVHTRDLAGFQHYEFLVSKELLANNTAMLQVAGNMWSPVQFKLSGENHTTIAIAGTDVSFKIGDSYTLIQSANGFTDENGTKITADTELSGIKSDMTLTTYSSLVRTHTDTLLAEEYELVVSEDGESLSMNVVKEINNGPGVTEINPETNALMESSLSTMTTHFAADDLFVDAVLRSRDGKRDGLFTAARGGKWSYDTRTRIENNIVSGLLGYGAKLSNDLTMGAFIEMGHGSYDTRTHVAGSTKAGGGSHNYGGLGVFGDYAVPTVEGLHFTGYLKVGLLRNEFNSNIAGANVDYDRTGVYWGAHLGTHYDWDLTQSIRSRVFLSYFYDGQGDESFDIAGEGDVGGAHVSYDAIHAHRVQLGSMFEFAVSDTWRPYLGLTFEQILAAEAKGTATDAQGTMDLNSSDLEGSTGILSAGWTYQDGNFSTELGLNGYAGTRNGVSGQIQANWKF